jgi:hypothetical protein
LVALATVAHSENIHITVNPDAPGLRIFRAQGGKPESFDQLAQRMRRSELLRISPPLMSPAPQLHARSPVGCSILPCSRTPGRTVPLITPAFDGNRIEWLIRSYPSTFHFHPLLATVQILP